MADEPIAAALRSNALRTPAFELGIEPADAGPGVWGVVMDVTLDDGGSYTTLALVDGNASIYIGEQAGVIGGFAHDEVRRAATAAVALANTLAHLFSRGGVFALPAPGFVRLYLRSRAGLLASPEIKEERLGEGAQPLSALFFAMHEVIGQLRMIEAKERGETPMTLSEGLTPAAELINAIAVSDRALVDTLLAAGADPNARDRSGIPALAIAASRRDASTLKALLDHGANPRVTVDDPKRGYRGSPVILFPAGNGDAKVLEALLEAKADPEAGDATGLTALMSAAFMGHDGIVDRLIVHGVSLEARDERGYTALMFACNAGKLAAVRRLLRAGANVNARDSDGSTPIMFAAQHGFDDVVRAALSSGADPERVGSHGLSAIGLAKQNGLKATLAILRDHSKRGA